MTAGPIREAIFLVRGGVPFDVAFGLDDVTRAGYCIILSELEGRKFDFNTMDYVPLD